jgi:hypothetical protein
LKAKNVTGVSVIQRSVPKRIICRRRDLTERGMYTLASNKKSRRKPLKVKKIGCSILED